MWRTALLLLLWNSVLLAQTADTALFRALLLPSSEVPAVNNLNARGVADISVNVVRDPSGQIVSGTIDILARVAFPGIVPATGLGIWSGPLGQNGTLAFNTALAPQSVYPMQANGDSIHMPVHISSANATALAALRNLFQNPTQHYVNLLTAANPNGALRGQLQRAQKTVLMARLSSANVVPPAFPEAFGAALIVAIGTRDASGNWTSGEIYWSATYNTQDQTAINGLQLHIGPPGANGLIAFTASLPGAITPPPDGIGVLGPYYTELSTITPLQTGSFSNLFTDPGALYVDVHTVANPLGSLRGQLHATDAMPFSVVLNSANEPRAPSATATAPANLTLYTLRDQDGSIAAATFLADVDYRFPGPTQFLGLFLHGALSLPIVPDFHSDTGFGNFYGCSLPYSDPSVLMTLDDLVARPETVAVDLHTLADPGGAARALLAPPPAGPAAIAAIVSGTLDPQARAIVPGELITIYGKNLARVATDLKGWSGETLPFALNGVRVTIGGRPAPLLYVGPGQINAQMPVDAANGLVVVSDSGGTVASYSAVATGNAPSIFFEPLPAILRNSDFSLVTPANPARPGDVLVVYATGLGQTTPAIPTGRAPLLGQLAATAAVTASIGGLRAPVVYSLASPSFPGVYQVAVTVPTGASGPSPLMLQQAGVPSNTVTVALR
jgi:uncharacterized protein (TIGR03437 family)